MVARLGTVFHRGVLHASWGHNKGKENTPTEINQEQGFSQEDFAAHAGIDHAYMGAIERGQRNVTFFDSSEKIVGEWGKEGQAGG